MKTFPEIIAESTEFVCAEMGFGTEDKKILRFAPVTRVDGKVWIHPTYAKESTLDEMRKCASIIWKVVDFWNPGEFRLIHRMNPALVTKLQRIA